MSLVMWNWHLQETLCEGKSRHGGVAVDRDCTLGFAASESWGRLYKALKFCSLLMKLTMTVPTLVAVCIVSIVSEENVKKNFSSYTHALPSKARLMSSTKLRQQYLHAHTFCGMKDSTLVIYSEINDTLALVCKTPCNHILLELYHPGKMLFMCLENTSIDFECHMLGTKCMLWMYAMWCKICFETSK